MRSAGSNTGNHMAEIPNDLIGQLQTALSALAQAPGAISDPLRDHAGAEVSMALDDLLAASYQIVEAAEQAPALCPAA